MDKMEEKIPTNTIPIQSEDLHYQVARIYGDLGEAASMKKIMETLIARDNAKPLNKVDYANTFYRELNDTELAINTLEDMRLTYLQLESMVQSRGFGNSTVRKGEWARWEKAYSEIISSYKFFSSPEPTSNFGEFSLSDILFDKLIIILFILSEYGLPFSALSCALLNFAAATIFIAFVIF